MKNETSPLLITNVNGEERVENLLELSSSTTKVLKIDLTSKLPKNKGGNKIKSKNDFVEEKDTTLIDLTDSKSPEKKSLKKINKKNTPKLVEEEDDLLFLKTPAETLFDDCFSKEKEGRDEQFDSIKSLMSDFNGIKKKNLTSSSEKVDKS